MLLTKFSACLCCCTVVILVLSGCDDPQARDIAANAGSKINELKIKVDEAAKKNTDTAKEIKELEERLSKMISDRLEKMEAKMSENHKAVLGQISQDMDKSRKEALGVAESGLEESKKELAINKSQVATDMQKIRDEMKTLSEELRKFMDNQLKELYPYAYQPRRMDPAVAPEAK